MKEKNFFYVFAMLFFAVILAILSLNYCIDYYGVFHKYKNEPVVVYNINDRFVKMRYLLNGKNFNKYDSYLWGSSRVMKMDTTIAGGMTYNLGSAGGMTDDCLFQLKQLISQGAKVNEIYVGLDDFSYTKNYEPVKREIDRKLYYGNILQDLGTYMEYLLNPSAIVNTIKRHSDRPIQTFLHSSGMALIPDYVDKEIEHDPEKHIQAQKFLAATNFGWDKNGFQVCLNNISLIKQICDENGIQLFVFFNPQHMTTYLSDDMELMNQFKKELVKISPFWDFSGVNYVTANNYFWYETSHPRAFICDKILDIVSGQNQMTWVPDFGVYVTPENVDAFCEQAVRDREAYDPDHAQWIPTAEERSGMSRRLHIY